MNATNETKTTTIRSIIYAGNCVDDPSEITSEQWDALAKMTKTALSASYPGAEVEVEIKQASGYGSGTTIDGERSEDAKAIAERAWQSWLETLNEPVDPTDDEPANRTFYATCDCNGPISVRIEAESIDDALEQIKQHGHKWIDEPKLDAEDELSDVCWENWTEEQVTAEMQWLRYRCIYQTNIAGDWCLWELEADAMRDEEDEATDAYRAGYMDGQTTAEESDVPSRLLGDGASDELVNSLTGRELGHAIGLTIAQVEERGEDFRRALELYDRGYADAVRAAVESDAD